MVAADLAGAEALYPTEKFEVFFRYAARFKVPFTIHAGEAAGADSVKAAVSFGAKRIGHGVRIFEDEDVMRLVKEEGVTLEMCPTSNRMTRAVTDMSKYPLMEYLEQGIKVTVNTDDPGIEGTTIKEEFRYLEQTFGLTPEQERVILGNAVDAAFTTAEVKEELRKQLGLL